MTKKIIAFFRFVLGIVLLALIGWGFVALVGAAWRSVISLQAEMATAVLAASATVLVSVITVFIGKYIEKRREIELKQREKKIEIYEIFMEKWFKYLLLGKSSAGKQVKDLSSDPEFMSFLIEFTRKLILWGSNGVVKEYSKFRRSGAEGSPSLSLYHFEKLLLAIRKDLGNSNVGLVEGDLLALFINDLETLKDTGAKGQKMT